MASPIMEALKQFAAAEANLAKAEKLWDELQELFPDGISVGETPEYEDRSRSFSILMDALPRIDGWLPEAARLGCDSQHPIRLPGPGRPDGGGSVRSVGLGVRPRAPRVQV